VSEEILDSVRSLADPKLKDLFDSLPGEFVEGVKEHIQGGLADRLKDALADAAELRYLALTAPASTPRGWSPLSAASR
jgi:hypothetical protein